MMCSIPRCKRKSERGIHRCEKHNASAKAYSRAIYWYRRGRKLCVRCGKRHKANGIVMCLACSRECNDRRERSRRRGTNK